MVRVSSPFRRVPPLAADLGLAVAFGVAWFVAFTFWRERGWYPITPSRWTIVAWWTMGAIAFRRTAPVAVAIVVLLTFPLVYGTTLLTELHLLPIIVAGAAGAAVSRQWLGFSLVAAAAGTFWLTTGGTTQFEFIELDEVLLNELLVLSVILLGAAVRSLRATTAELGERNLELEQLRRIETERAVTDERTRISRELHDVVAHHLTAMVVRTQAATHVSSDRSPEDAETLQWLTDSAREALAATRRTVGALREPDHSAPLAPVPRLDEIDAAVERVRAAGLNVTFETAGSLPSLTAETELAIVRIAQESLTNVMKHSGASTVSVSLRQTGTDVVLRVTDDGRGRPPGAMPATGSHGLIGMTERATSCGGRLDVTAADGVGWAVEASFPLGTGS